jgi:ribosomal protein L40E
VNIGTVNHEERWDYFAARKLLRELAERAGIRKRVTAYSFRHARATQLANYLTEAQLCQHFGWRQGSKMPRTYVHLSGRDVDNRLLELHGLKPKLEGELIQTVKVCIRCSAKNGPESRFCNRCGLPVDLKTALQLDTRIERAEELMEVLLRDSEVKALLTQKLRELRLAEKFG